MKARNNCNDSFVNDYLDSNHLDGDNFTPVNNKKKRFESLAPNQLKSAPESTLSPDKSNVSKKLNFDIFTPDKEMKPTILETPVREETTETWVPVAPKKSRRNLDALGETVSQPIFENSNKRQLISATPMRELSGLEQDILRSQNPRRDLSKLGDIVESEQRVQREKQEQFMKRAPRYEKHQVHEEPVPEKQVTVNMDDSTLFPTLGSSVNEIKKVSVWNVFNPTLLQAKDDVQDDKTIPKVVLKRTTSNIPKSVSVYNSSHVYNSSPVYNSDEDDDEDYEDAEDDEDDEDYEDSEEAYMREKYYKRDELLDNIEFVKEHFNKRNRDHVRFLRQLECELADIEDEIYRYEDLENEMEKIYGPNYRNQPSLLDEEIRRREHEDAEIEAKRKDPEAWKEFFRILETVKA